MIYNLDCATGIVLSGFKLFDKDNNLLLQTLYNEFNNFSETLLDENERIVGFKSRRHPIELHQAAHVDFQFVIGRME